MDLEIYLNVNKKYDFYFSRIFPNLFYFILLRTERDYYKGKTLEPVYLPEIEALEELVDLKSTNWKAAIPLPQFREQPSERK